MRNFWLDTTRDIVFGLLGVILWVLFVGLLMFLGYPGFMDTLFEVLLFYPMGAGLITLCILIGKLIDGNYEN